MFKPELNNDKCLELGIDPIEDEALAINGHKREVLALAPPLKVGWEMFIEFVNRFNPKKTQWNAPIGASFNGNNFDNFIISRLCREFGPWDDKWESQKLFHPFNHVDIMTDFFRWTENSVDIKSISMDSIREWLGISKDGAHNAMKDVEDGADLLIRFMKLYRAVCKKVKFGPKADKVGKS